MVLGERIGPVDLVESLWYLEGVGFPRREGVVLGESGLSWEKGGSPGREWVVLGERG